MPETLSKLKLVPIGGCVPERSLQGFGGRILRAFGAVLRELEIVQYDPPGFDRIQASLLTRALEQEVGGHILGVTDADLVDNDGNDFFNFMFGGKDNRNCVAVVSTRRLRNHDGRLSLDRVLKVALHELGHNFGLGHHYSFEPAPDGAYCPMSKGGFNGYGEHGYVHAVIDSRGFTFCERCRELLYKLSLAARPL